MKRGDIVVVHGSSGPAGKPRPCVIVQRDSTLDDTPKVTVCPITSTVGFESPFRPLISPTTTNGLRRPSQVEADWIYTYNRSRIRDTIGRLCEDDLRRVDVALRLWFGL